jgi:hypothetical protein
MVCGPAAAGDRAAAALASPLPHLCVGGGGQEWALHGL